MSEHVWADVHHRAVESFGGQTPGRELEASIVERFEQRPESVIAALEKLAARFDAGRVHSPWPLVLRELDDESGRDRLTIVADGKQEQAKRARQAEAWIRNAGLHAPTEAEVIHELYEARSSGHRLSSQALLAPWADDDGLRARMLELWRQVRPLGEQCDRESWERAASQVEARARLKTGDGGAGPVEHPPPPVADPYGQPDLDGSASASVVAGSVEDLWPSRLDSEVHVYPDEELWRGWSEP